MGTWEGHVLPSIIYSCLALWWGFVTSLRFARAELNKNCKYKSTTTMPCFCCPSRRLRTMPIESYFKCFFLTIHMFLEITIGLHYEGPKLVLGPENAHHVCMLSGFLLASIVEILIYYGVPFPKGTEFAMNGLGFLIQALIMTVHLDGDHGLEQQVHKLWTIVSAIRFRFYTHHYLCISCSVYLNFPGHSCHVRGWSSRNLQKRSLLAVHHSHLVLFHARHMAHANRVRRLAEDYKSDVHLER